MSSAYEHQDESILEGFLCPMCKSDLKSADRLLSHFDSDHSEDQDLLKSFKDIFLTAKKKIRQFEENVTNPFNENDSSIVSSTASPQRQQPVPKRYTELQTIGADLDHISYFKAIRAPRSERFATDTNKLIIRLQKLLADRPVDAMQRKQYEQTIVPWLDGKSVKLCPCCAKKFHLTRRQHHCRLCGSIMCDSCSIFYDVNDAMALVDPNKTSSDNSSAEANDTLRVCEHCFHLLDNRRSILYNQTVRTPITIYYEKIQQLKSEVTPHLATYSKMVKSLYEGDSDHTLAEAGALRAKIGHIAEKIDEYSKAMLTLERGPNKTRQDDLKKFIRLACVKFIKDQMLCLEALPLESDIKEMQRKRKQETEQRIERERRLAMEQWERIEGNRNDISENTHQTDSRNFASGSAITSIDNWSGRQTVSSRATNDPLIEQINIIKGYIKQARDAHRYEEVETLETNLRELQQEFYQRQQKS